MSHKQIAGRQVKDLTQGAIPAHIFRLAIPILGTSFVQMLYSFTDMAWLGRVNNEAVAAVGAASVFTWLASSISQINKVGSEVTVAHAIGKGDQEQGRLYASHNLMLSWLIGLLLAISYLIWGDTIVGWYSLAQEIHNEGVTYLKVVSLGLPFVFVAGAFTGIYNATGHSKIPFIISSIGLVLNMLLDPLFIFVFGMGSVGAAWATVISQIAVALLFGIQIWMRDALLGGVAIATYLKRSITMRILAIGIPVALLNSLFSFINMYLGRLASLTGGHIGVLTLTTGGQLEAISWNTAQGFATALSAFVSQNCGAKRYDRVLRSVAYTFRLTLLFGIGTTLLYTLGGKELFSIIVPDIEAYTAGGMYLRISGYSQLFMVLEITSQGFFFGIRNTKLPAAISIGGNLLRIPMALIALQYYPSIETLWWVITLSSTIKGLLAYLCYLYERKRLVRLQSTP